MKLLFKPKHRIINESWEKCIIPLSFIIFGVGNNKIANFQFSDYILMGGSKEADISIYHYPYYFTNHQCDFEKHNPQRMFRYTQQKVSILSRSTPYHIHIYSWNNSILIEWGYWPNSSIAASPTPEKTALYLEFEESLNFGIRRQFFGLWGVKFHFLSK